MASTAGQLSLIARSREPTGGIRLQVIRQLRPYEASRYDEASEHVTEFERSRDLLWLVDQNLAALKHTVDLLGAAARSSSKSRRNATFRLTRHLNGQVVNYLNAVRLYLDHRATQLKRRYGESGDPFVAFEETRRAVFDAEPVYRFVYIFRNYVQHCGMPLQIVRSTRRLVETAGQEIPQTSVFVGCSRDKLLSDYSEWRHARQFVEEQDPEFELIPLLIYNRDLLWRIEEAVVRAQITGLWKDARFIVTLLSEASDAQSTGTVGQVTYDPQKTTVEQIEFHDPPLNTLRNLKLIRPGGPEVPWRVNHDILAIDKPPSIT